MKLTTFSSLGDKLLPLTKRYHMMKQFFKDGYSV